MVYSISRSYVEKNITIHIDTIILPFCIYTPAYELYHLYISGLGSAVVRSLSAGAKGRSFIPPFNQHFQIFISRAFTFNAVGSLVSRWAFIHHCGFISCSFIWIQLCNNLWQMLCMYIMP